MRGALGTIIKCFKRGTRAAAAGAGIQGERVRVGRAVEMSECRLTAAAGSGGLITSEMS